MKKLLIIAAVSLVAVGSLTAFTVANSNKNEEASACQYGGCYATNKKGQRCGNCAQKGSSYCWSHNN